MPCATQMVYHFRRSAPMASSDCGLSEAPAADVGPITVVFDLDGTLYHENTTMVLVERFLHEHAPRRWLLFRTARTLPGKVFWRFAEAMTRADPFRRCVVGALRGVPVASFTHAAETYVERDLPSAAIGAVMERLAACRDAGKRTVLASASLDPIVSAVGERLCFDAWVATSLAVRNGVLTGALENDVRGRKLEALRSGVLAAGNFEVVTDNFDDIDLIEAAKHATVVTRSRHVTRWRAVLPAGTDLLVVGP